MTALPGHVRRHFPDGAGDLAEPAQRSAAIARLLEDGDRRDLAWLVATVGPEAVRAWIGTHGARRLSRRSRSFWSLAAGVPCESSPAAEALWPLA
jgi:hypothetical protein